jgi:hypothetical protein
MNRKKTIKSGRHILLKIDHGLSFLSAGQEARLAAHPWSIAFRKILSF